MLTVGQLDTVCENLKNYFLNIKMAFSFDHPFCLLIKKKTFSFDEGKNLLMQQHVALLLCLVH